MLESKRQLAGRRRLTVSAIALFAVVACSAVSAATTFAAGGDETPKANNGECLVSINKPQAFTAPARVVSRSKGACIHNSSLDAQVQLWRAAGAAGVKGDVKVNDTGFVHYHIIRGTAAVKSTDYQCPQSRHTHRFYLKVRVRSTVPGEGTQLKTSKWVKGNAASLSC